MSGALSRIGPSESQAIAEARHRERQRDHDRRQRDQRRADERAHQDSRVRASRAQRPPATLDGLLHWFDVAVGEEAPGAIHASAVFHTRQRYDAEGRPVVPSEEVGGSALGAKAYSDAMRRRIENSPHELDDDGHYVRPLASALQRMRVGSRDRPPAPRTVEHLCWLAFSPSDWRNLRDRMAGIDEEVLAVYLHRALEMLWFLYRPHPPLKEWQPDV